MKYNRTYHLPFSPGTTNDDRINYDWQGILEHELVITEKLDGENTCLKTSGVYARSHGAVNQNPWARNMWEIWERVKMDLEDEPENLDIFGENLYGVHSIEYTNLEHYFFTFAMRKGETWLSWEQVEEISYLLSLPIAPVIAKGKFTEEDIKNIIDENQKNGSAFGGESEGVVIRIADSFHNNDFSNSVLKWVREGHVKTDEHWTRNWKRAKLIYEKM